MSGFASFLLGIFVASALTTAVALRAQRRLRRVEAQLASTNRTLEETVNQRMRELRRAERKYRSLLGQAATGILLWDPTTLEIAEANAKAGELLGERPRDLLHRCAESLFPPSDQGASIRALRRVTEVGSVRLEEVQMCRAQATFPTEVTASLVRFGDEAIVLVMLRDLTVSKEVERRAALLAEKVKSQERLASIGQLAAGVAHEINNPMGYVASNVNRLVEFAKRLVELIPRTAEPEGSERVLSEIHELIGELDEIACDASEGVSRVTEIVRALREFSHGGHAESHFQHADINNVVRNCLTLVQNKVRDRADVELDLNDIPRLHCHPLQIGQILMNLIVNAAQSFETRGTIQIGTYATHDRIQIAVEDDGGGIPEEHLTRVFEPFFTTKPVGQGTGLGLSVSQEIAHRYEGELWIDSQVGRGTRVVVELPLERVSDPPPQAPPRRPSR